MLIKHKDYNFEVSHIFVFPEQLMKHKSISLFYIFFLLYFLTLNVC